MTDPVFCNPVFCTLEHRHAILFSGDEARGFLHNLLTCDIGALAHDRFTHGGFCTPKGRLLATFLVWCSDQGYILQVPAPIRESTQKRLSMYILRSRVRSADVSGVEARFGVSGSASAELVARLLAVPAPEPMGVVRAQDATVIGLQPDRFEIVVSALRADSLRRSLLESAVQVASTHWDWLDICAGVPVILPETQEEFVPQMVNLDCIGGISFTKGCYPGQEIVARMHYLGRLKQRMYLAHVEGDIPPRPGDRLYGSGFGDQAAGMIVNAAPAPSGGHDVLAVVQIGAVDSGSVHWNGPDHAALQFRPLPYPI